MKPVTRAIVTLAIGEKYLALYRRREEALARLAYRSNAILHCVTKPLDQARLRPILFQKLLIPDAMREYDEILFLDLDILFREDISDPFADFDPAKGLAAVLQPRGTRAYAEVAARMWRRPELGSRRGVDYFEEQGLPVVEGLVGPINGGVWLCRPRLLADPFKDAYYDIEKWRYRAKHEEPALAWLPQSMQLFQALPFSYNAQLCFAMFASHNVEFGYQFTQPWRCFLRSLAKRYAAFKGLNVLGGYNKAYNDFVASCVREYVFVHFSGDMLIPG